MTSSEEEQRVIDAIVAARDNVTLIRDWGGALDLNTLRSDRKTRYAIERAFMALDAAVKDIPPDLLAAHGIPANMIAGFRNVLAHTYDDIMDERVIVTINDDLPVLDIALSSALASKRG